MIHRVIQIAHARLGGWLILAAFVILALIAGLKLRRWAFEYSEPIRFVGDIERGFYWGRQCLEHGYLQPYEMMKAQLPTTENWLDYAPLRLLVMDLWAHINAGRFPGVTNYQSTYEFTKPVLWFNSGLEIINAIGIFLLTRLWVARCDPTIRFGGAAHGLGAALLAWFNPAMILSGHCWPTWDLWIVPFFIWAVWCAVKDWWFVAGVVIGIGAMFKGQQFAIAPMFLLWPIYLRQPTKALRWLIGLAFPIALLASPWLLTYLRDDGTRAINGFPLLWVICLTTIAAAACYRFRQKISRRDGGYLLAAVLSVALLTCMPLFHTSTAWADCAWGYGTRHWPLMYVGQNSNLPALLSIRFGWNDIHATLFTIPPHALLLWPWQAYDVSLKVFLFSIYALLLVICCIGIARHYRRNDRRFLVAIVTPWLLFFSIPVQVHERYLLFAAGAGCILVGCGLGMTLLDLFLTAVTFIMTFHTMYTFRPASIFNFTQQFGHSLYNFARGTIRTSPGRFCSVMRFFFTIL